MNEKGKFVAIYGMNNLGKTTALDVLIPRLEAKGMRVLKLKYPIYDMEPTGSRVNSYLRSGNPENLTAFEAQKIYAQNRRDFEPQLIRYLNENDVVIAEDYTGTGLAWGQILGAPLADLEAINQGLLATDLAILFDGERIKSGVEANHKHEGVGDEVWNRGRRIHLELAEKYGWRVVRVGLGELEREVLEVEELVMGEIGGRGVIE